MKKMINNTHVEGYVYEHNLELKTSGPNSKNPGTEFISGTLSIATDPEFLNVIQIHYTYVTAVTAKGSPNNTYNTLKAIMDGKIGNAMEHGRDNAAKVRIDSALALNEWYDTRSEDRPLISQKRNEGGFIHQVTLAEMDTFKPNATFDCDFLITKATRKEPDEERNLPEKMILKGYIFDFRGTLLPFDFTVTAPRAMDYFESQEPSEKRPFFTRIKGDQISQTIVREIKQESAFGDASVETVRSSQREFRVTWGSPNPYELGGEDTITAAELTDLVAKREVYLADLKKRQDEYLASRNNGFASASATAPKKGDYDF